MKEKVDVFVCSNCKYEDGSVINMGHTERIECPKCRTTVNTNIVEMNFEPYMTIKEFNDLIRYINENHNFKKLKGKMIKYISPTIDFRTCCIGKVTLDDKVFLKVNENRHKNLYK